MPPPPPPGRVNGLHIPSPGSDSASTRHLPTWRKMLADWTQDTTLHGIRYTTLSTRFKSRRVLWTLVMLVAISVFIYYVADRVSEYLLFKKNVNVVLDYVDSMEFPVVTLCNENQFRLTAAIEGGWYDQVETMLQLVSTISGVSCTDGEWRCNDGGCIPDINRCDAFADCSQGEDERNCAPCALVLVSSSALGADLAGHLYERLDWVINNRTVFSKLSSYPKRFLYFDGSVWVFAPDIGAQPVAVCTSSACDSEFIGGTGQHMWSYNGTQALASIDCYVHPRPDMMSLLATDPVQDLTLQMMYDLGAHQLETFVDGCTFKGEPCDMVADFNTTYTDMGVCYTFYRPGAVVEQSGPGFALRLTLNMEQYQYTKDTQTGVGVRMLIHDIDDLPLMKERSFAVSPGLSSLVAMEKTSVENLAEPWGNCFDADLFYYPVYTTSACSMNCENYEARSQCECIDIHMPSTGPEDYPLCSVDQFVTCLQPRLEMARQSGNFCTSCTTPCTELNYVPSLSFASISMDEDSDDPEQLARIDRLSESLIEAREVRFRISNDKYTDTIRKIYGMLADFTRQSQTLSYALDALNSEARTVFDNVAKVKSDCVVIGTLQYGLYQELRIGLFEEAYRLTTAFKDMIFNNMKEVKWLMSTALAAPASGSVPGELAFLYSYNASIWLTLKGLEPSIAVFEEQYYTQLLGSASNATMTANYRLLDELMSPILDYSRVHCDWCVTSAEGGPDTTPCSWCPTVDTPLAEIVTKSIDLYLRDTFKPAFDTIVTEVTTLTATYDTAVGSLVSRLLYYTTNGGAVSAPATYNQVLTPIVPTVDATLSNIEALYQEVLASLKDPVWLASEQVVELQRLLSPMCESEMTRYYNEYSDTHTQLSATLQYTVDNLNMYNATYTGYLADYQTNQMNLYEMVEANDCEAMKTFLSGQVLTIEGLLNQRAIAASRIEAHINHVNYWFLAQLDRQFLASNSQFWLLFNIQDPGVNCPSTQHWGLGQSCAIEDPEVTAFWDTLEESLDNIKLYINSGHTNVINGITDYENYILDYDEGNKVDSYFYTKNYMQVDFFYKELLERVVVQEKAYEYPTLLGELGGLMGLLIGASALTVVEFLDTVTYYGFLKCLNRNKTWRTNRKEAKNSNC